MDAVYACVLSFSPLNAGLSFTVLLPVKQRAEKSVSVILQCDSDQTVGNLFPASTVVLRVDNESIQRCAVLTDSIKKEREPGTFN